MMAWAMLGSVGWATRVAVGDTGFSLETPDGLTLEQVGVKNATGQFYKGNAYRGDTKEGLRVLIYTLDSPASRVAGTFLTPITNGFYKGLLSGLYGDKAKIRFDNQKIVERQGTKFYTYDLIIDYPNGIENYERAILSTNKSLTVVFLIGVDISTVGVNTNNIEKISNSIAWNYIKK